MPTPKYARRLVKINPMFPVPRGVEGVVIDDSAEGFISPEEAARDNSYIGPIKSQTPIGAEIIVPGGTSANAGGVTAKLVGQELIINSNGELVVEVTFELPAGDYAQRVERL